jgi:sigma-B regulation protein RsbU (phosphoserine phosphatase)
VTFFYAVLDAERHSLQFGSAGHNPAYLLKADGRLQELKPGGMALGIFGGEKFGLADETLALAPGELVVLYTDGITEAMDPQFQEYGEARLKELLLKHRQAPLPELKRLLLEDVARFVSGAPPHDDITLLMFRRSA